MSSSITTASCCSNVTEGPITETPLNGGAIAGIVLGTLVGVAAIVACAVLVIYIVKRKKMHDIERDAEFKIETVNNAFVEDEKERTNSKLKNRTPLAMEHNGTSQTNKPTKTPRMLLVTVSNTLPQHASLHNYDGDTTSDNDTDFATYDKVEPENNRVMVGKDGYAIVNKKRKVKEMDTERADESEATAADGACVHSADDAVSGDSAEDDADIISEPMYANFG